jgi:hypothetical protein
MIETRDEAVRSLALHMHAADCIGCADIHAEPDPWYLELAKSALEWVDDHGVRTSADRGQQT